MTPVPPHSGRSTVRVSMINNGFLTPSKKDRWIKTDEDETVCMPVLCFLIEKDDKCYLWDLGMRPDVENVGAATRQTWQGIPPVVRRPLPSSLPDAVLASLRGVFLSHYHWDHIGDVRTVPAHVPVFVGAGTTSGILQDRLGKHVGNKEVSYLERLEELPVGDTAVLGMEHEGVDFFGDGSLMLVPAPGHCPGHTIAIARVSASPASYIVLAGDAGHNRALYDPCPCHHAIATFSPLQPIHQDAKAATKTLENLSRMHDREDTWVILAHEYEVEKVVPEDTDLSDWQNKGWKEKVAAERASASKLSCYA